MSRIVVSMRKAEQSLAEEPRWLQIAALAAPIGELPELSALIRTALLASDREQRHHAVAACVLLQWPEFITDLRLLITRESDEEIIGMPATPWTVVPGLRALNERNSSMDTQLMLVCADGTPPNPDSLLCNRGFRAVVDGDLSVGGAWRWTRPETGESVTLVKNARFEVFFLRVSAVGDELGDLIADLGEVIPLCSFEDVLDMSADGPHSLEIAALVAPIGENERLATMINDGLDAAEFERRADAVQACAALAWSLFSEGLRKLIDSETDADLRADAKDALWACEDDSIGPIMH